MTLILNCSKTYIVSFPFPSAIATTDPNDIVIDIGLILGVCGVFVWYVITVSNIAVHFYWFLPVITAGSGYFTSTISYCVMYCSMDMHCSIPISTHTSPLTSIFSYSLSLLLWLYSSLCLLFHLLPLQASLVLMFCSTYLGS